MKSSKQIFLTCSIIILITVMIVVFMRKDNNAQPPLQRDVVIDLIKDNKATIWDNYVPFIVEDDYKKIDGNIILRDSLDKTSTLGSLISNKYKVIFRYSTVDCDMCVDSVMSMLGGVKKAISFFDALAITDSSSDRDFLIKAKDRKYPIPLYNIQQQDLGLFTENKGFPFLFVLTPDFHVIKLFIPSKENPRQIKDYLRKVTEYVKAANKDVL